MSKGNLFLGQGRGKVGDIVFSRNGGEQVARTRNRHPRNPQTPAQMFQRGCLATVSEMYIRGTRNFFKYAFTNKTAAQSEFNKFCQINIGRVPCNSREALRAGAPAIGNFVMTQGTLQPMNIERAEDNFILRLRNDVAAGTGADWTVGDVSRALIRNFGYQDGDIITFLCISCPATPLQTISQMGTVASLTSIAGVPLWNIKQFRLSSTSTDAMSTLAIFRPDSEGNTLVLAHEYAMDEMKVEGLCLVCSRNIKGGVAVSTSVITCNAATQNAIDLGMSDEWKEMVARYWVPDSSGDLDPVNILQGSLSVPQQTPPEPSVSVSLSKSLPDTVGNLAGAELTITPAQSGESLGDHLKIKSNDKTVLWSVGMGGHELTGRLQGLGDVFTLEQTNDNLWLFRSSSQQSAVTISSLAWE